MIMEWAEAGALFIMRDIKQYFLLLNVKPGMQW
jgi:hypothetical protein